MFIDFLQNVHSTSLLVLVEIFTILMLNVKHFECTLAFQIINPNFYTKSSDIIIKLFTTLHINIQQIVWNNHFKLIIFNIQHIKTMFTIIAEMCTEYYTNVHSNIHKNVQMCVEIYDCEDCNEHLQFY